MRPVSRLPIDEQRRQLPTALRRRNAIILGSKGGVDRVTGRHAG